MKLALLVGLLLSALFVLLTLLDSLAALAVPIMIGLFLFDLYIAFFAEKGARGDRGR